MSILKVVAAISLMAFQGSITYGQTQAPLSNDIFNGRISNRKFHFAGTFTTPEESTSELKGRSIETGEDTCHTDSKGGISFYTKQNLTPGQDDFSLVFDAKNSLFINVTSAAGDVASGSADYSYDPSTKTLNIKPIILLGTPSAIYIEEEIMSAQRSNMKVSNPLPSTNKNQVSLDFFQGIKGQVQVDPNNSNHLLEIDIFRPAFKSKSVIHISDIQTCDSDGSGSFSNLMLR